ncbi:M3 family oligoendopeptidase [Marivibrio halodurans]|uniref:M3 family oligoendopeptidase n=1 Tax=Marivibrio halodurans TaxID=2039722 RepID=A0A8J7S4P0_9PROT|nr:M3 family oligoendopeptidase [Marivibrio halodurans]MBP5856674.1 M3 family oligoendopeptidase [Marivibrio halodurans]
MPDTATASGEIPTDENGLPLWNLDDLYPGVDSDALARDFEALEKDAGRFAEAHAGKLAELDGNALAGAVAEYERIEEIMGRIGSYAGLMHAGDVSDPEVGRFYQNTIERLNAISSTLLFFQLEINRIDEEDLEAKLAESPALAHYRPWIRDSRAMRGYELDDEMEKLLLEKAVAGRGAWTRLFDQTLAGLRFPYRGEMLTNTDILHLMSDPDGSVRRDAARSLGETLGENIQLFSLITNTLAKDKEVEDRWRGFARPVSSRNLANFVEDEVVDALVQSVREAYPRISHRYYKLKARWMGAETLDYWDRLAPPPQDDDRTIEWDQARETVLSAYGRFDPAMADLGKRFFDNGWIDAPPRPGKAGGAFAHPTVPSAHPYLLLNFKGKARDVMTLAHELGHGVHQVLAGKQGQLMADTPLTLAETASVFGEMLTFQSMLAGTEDPKRRRALLANKIEDMINTVVRQIAFFEFERRIHDARRDGELTADRIGEIWMECSRESLGDTFRFGAEYANFWAYIPHFIHSPFYVYAYAFGDCLVNSLYALYEGGHPDFQKKYLTMLEAGGTLRHKDLLAPFGLDASDPAFWNQGLGVIERFIDELEATF